MVTGQKQISLFEESEVETREPDKKAVFRLGSKAVKFPLQKKRRTAVTRLVEILRDLEGKDVYIGSYNAGGGHFWLDNLKLTRLKLDWYPPNGMDRGIYSTVVLWGSRGAAVRIFTDYLVDVREQEYQGYFHYLLDFRNGFYGTELDKYKNHYACLTITRFKD